MKIKIKQSHVLALALALPISAASAFALAFPFGYSWMQPAHGVLPQAAQAHDVQGRAGGGGIWGTGSKMDKGIKCSHCHTDPPAQIGFQLAFNPQLSGGTAYVPGTTYEVTVTLTNEVKLPGNGIAHTLNGFGLTFEGQDGQRAGTLRSDISGIDSASCPQTFPQPPPASGTSYVYGNCDAIVFIPRDDITEWRAGWTAPPAGSGPVTMWYAIVDGDEHGSSSLGDDVVEGQVALTEGP